MPVGFFGSQVGAVPLAFGASKATGRRPLLASGSPSGYNAYRSWRHSLTRESESTFLATGNGSFSGLNAWAAVDNLGRTNGAVPVPATEKRFTLYLRTTGGQVLVYFNCTCADTSAGVIGYFDVSVDWPGTDIVGDHPTRLARSIAPSLNHLAFRGAEVNSGTGNADFRVVTKRLPAGLHAFTLLTSHSSNVSTNTIGHANPRQGTENDGWCAFGVVEIPDTDKFPGLLSNLAHAANQGHTVVVPGPNFTLGAPWQGSIPISGGAASEGEGAYVCTSTTFVTMDSIKPGGITNNRFTQRLFLKRGGPALILVGVTMGSTNAGDSCFIDIRLDGVRLGGTNGLAQRGAEVANGTGSIHLEYVTQHLSQGWHEFALMARVSGNSTSFNLCNASQGSENTGWCRMHVVELQVAP